MAKILEVKNLSVQINNTFRAVKNISFSLFENETVALVGETGAGKTTAAQAIAQLNHVKPQNSPFKTFGQIVFEKQNLLQLSFKKLKNIRGHKISYIFQDPHTFLNPLIKIKKQLLENTKINKKDLVSLLKFIGFSNPLLVFSKYPHELSGGEKQRLLIAMALAFKPKILIADEPATALDATSQNQIIQLFKTLQNERALSILLISHNLKLVASLAQKIMIMYAGEIIEEGPTEQILKQPKHPYTQLLLKMLPSLKKSIDYTEIKPFSHTSRNPKLPDSEGCVFVSRCPYASAFCFQQKPALTPFKEQKIACFLFQPKEKAYAASDL